MSGQILVIGAANTDLTAYVDRIPEGGETIHGDLFTTGFGGKGANQAVAAKRAGADVALIAGLGADIFGQNTKAHLEAEGVDTSAIFYGKQPSGVAHIWVDSKGENRIIIIPGVNLELTREFIESAVLKISNLSIVIAQCELPQKLQWHGLWKRARKFYSFLINILVATPQSCSWDFHLMIALSGIHGKKMAD